MNASLLITSSRQPAAAILDEDHLQRMTLGDRGLEREVLEIFIRQAALMLRRISGAKPALAAAAAHTLKGSARGIGAWRVAQAADRLEQTAAGGDSLELSRRRSRNSRPQAARRVQRSSRVWPIVLTAPAPRRPVGAGATIDPVRTTSTGAPQPKSIEEAAATPAIYGAVRRAPVSPASRFQS